MQRAGKIKMVGCNLKMDFFCWRESFFPFFKLYIIFSFNTSWNHKFWKSDALCYSLLCYCWLLEIDTVKFRRRFTDVGNIILGVFNITQKILIT